MLGEFVTRLSTGGRMGARQLVGVGFRLMALWLCFGATQAAGIVSWLQNRRGAFSMTPHLGLWMLLTGVGVALALWALSGVLAAALTHGLPDETKPRWSPLDAVAVGCVLMGLWWLKDCLVPLAALWLNALASSSEMGQSVIAWLGAQGRTEAGRYLAQMAVAGYFVARPYPIARWLLRHAPVIPQTPVSVEPFDVVLRRSRELGLRQVARPDIVESVVSALASHPDATSRLPEVIALLGYEDNHLTRQAAAHAITRMGRGAAVHARDVASEQLRVESDANVTSRLRELIELAGSINADGEVAST